MRVVHVAEVVHTDEPALNVPAQSPERIHSLDQSHIPASTRHWFRALTVAGNIIDIAL